MVEFVQVCCISYLLAFPRFHITQISDFMSLIKSDIASEPTSLISCLVEGFRRIIPNTSTSGPRMGSIAGNLKANLRSIPITTSRLLPAWRLLFPVVVFGVGHHMIKSVVWFTAASYFRQNMDPEQLDAELADSRTRGVSRYFITCIR